MQKNRKPLNSARAASFVRTGASTDSAMLAITCALSLCAPALAGPNDFFGSQVPSNSEKQQGTSLSSPSNPYSDPVLPKGDFTEDEKRMQKKYRGSMRNARDLVAKGTQMMEAGQRKKNDKLYKKGKVLKEIGERQLAELKENNPLADLADGAGNKRKQTADAQSSSTQ